MSQVTAIAKLEAVLAKQGVPLPVLYPSNFDERFVRLLDLLAENTYRGAIAPVNPRIGQRWIEESGGVTQEWEWTGGYWATIKWMNIHFYNYATVSIDQAEIILPIPPLASAIQIRLQTFFTLGAGSGSWVVNTLESGLSTRFETGSAGWEGNQSAYQTPAATVLPSQTLVTSVARNVLPVGHNQIGLDVTKVGSPPGLYYSTYGRFRGVR